MGDKKNLVFMYGVSWDYEPIPHCPECESLLTYKYDAPLRRKVFCDHCKKTSLIYDYKGNYITIKKAIDLMRAKFSNRMEDGGQKGEREDTYEDDGEPVEEKIMISNRYIIHGLTDISIKVDKVVTKMNALYDLIEYNETFLLDKLNKILRILGEKKE